MSQRIDEIHIYASFYLRPVLFILKKWVKPLQYDSKTLTLTWLDLSTYALDFYKSFRTLFHFPFVVLVFLLFLCTFFPLFHASFLTMLTPKNACSNNFRGKFGHVDPSTLHNFLSLWLGNQVPSMIF